MTNANPIINKNDCHEIAETPREGGFERQRLNGTNVNPETLLATDFLNHFNVVEMIVEMLPQSPECFEELLAWQPRSYLEHFASSSLRDADLALEAYDHVPEKLRESFEDVVERLNQAALRAIRSAGIALKSKNPDIIAFACARAAGELRVLVREAGSLINGTSLSGIKPNGANQAAIDAWFDD